jgi:hypothetical protein
LEWKWQFILVAYVQGFRDAKENFYCSLDAQSRKTIKLEGSNLKLKQ